MELLPGQNLSRALNALRPGATFNLRAGDDYDGLEWLDGSVKPTAQQVSDWLMVNPIKPSFVARDLLDLLTTDDLAAIRTTIASNVSLDLVWTRMTGRGDKPISTGSPDFAAGWAGLTAALGQTRADELAEALGLSAS